MSELSARTPAEALAALPAAERLELLGLAVANRRMTTIEHRLDILEHHLAGNCLDDCPCQPGSDGVPSGVVSKAGKNNIA